MSTAPRYKRSGLAAEALRRALRQQISSNKYGAGPGKLNDRQRAGLQSTVQNRLSNMQKNQPGMSDLAPALRKRFLGVRSNLQDSGWKPAPISNNAPKPQGNQGSPVQAGGPGGQVGTPTPVATPSMKINPNGQLDLPYDGMVAFSTLNAQHQANQQLMDLQMQKQNQDMEYGQLKRDADINYQDLARQTLNKHAASGAAFSSAHGYNVGRNATDFNNYMGDLDQADTLFEQGIASQTGGIQTRLNELLSQLAFDQAQRLEQDAGDLGFGQDSPEPSYDAPKPNNPKPKSPAKTPSRKDLPGHHDRIQRLASQGLNKKQIVAKLTGNKAGSGGAKELSKNQLKAIGFSSNFIKKATSKPAKKKGRR